MLTRLLSLAFLLTLLAAPGRAQTQPALPWNGAQVLLSDYQSTTGGLATDAAGNAYLVGTFQQTLTLGAGTSYMAEGQQDSYVAKFAPNGSLLWAWALPGAAYTVAHSLVLDAAGDVYVGGYYTARMRLGSLSLNSSGGDTHLFLAKLSAQGQPQWLRELGRGNMCFSSGMGLDAAGNAYFSGSFVGSISFGSLTLNLNSQPGLRESAAFLVKFDPQGTALWAREGGRETPQFGVSQYAPGLLVSPAGAAYLLWASTPGAGGFGSLPLPATGGDNDAVIVKYDAQGTPQWLKVGGGPGADVVQRATLDGTGQLLVTGFFEDLAVFDNQAVQANQRSGLLLALDEASGAVNWIRGVLTNSLNGTACYGLSTDAAGNSYVGSSTDLDAIIEGQTFQSQGGRDALVVSYTSQGLLRWVRQSTGAGDEYPRLLAPAPNGELVVAGSLRGAGRFGSTALVSSPNTIYDNAFLARLGTTVSATRPAAAGAALRCFPNPAAAGGQLTLPALPAGTRLRLRDALGRTVREQPAALVLPLAGLAPGTYLIEATAPDGRVWRARQVVE